MCKELQLLKVLVSVFPLCGEFSMNSHFTLNTSNECKPSLLTIVQGWRFAIGFSQNALYTQFLANILFTDEA
jgi:hypothetical protein